MARKLPSRRKSAPTPAKARKILREGRAQGQPLSKKQRGFFGAVAGKRR